MKPPLPPEREGKRRAAPKGRACPDKAYDRVPTERSRELRNNATPAERKLWNALKNRQLSGVRFNRQVVIRPFICDLVARSAKMVIEIDGGQHGEEIGYDGARTAFLQSKGYRLLRFWNNDVIGNLEGVVTTIEAALQTPPLARAGGVESAQPTGGGPVAAANNNPSPSSQRSSSPPAPAGGEKWP